MSGISLIVICFYIYYAQHLIVLCFSMHNIHSISFFSFLSRNIEEILASKGESVKRVSDSEGTVELTLEDVVGEGVVKKLTNGRKEES